MRIPPEHASSARPGTEAGAPKEEELRELAELRRAAGEAPWTAGQVAALRWQLRLLEVWPKRLQRCADSALACAALRSSLAYPPSLPCFLAARPALSCCAHCPACWPRPRPAVLCCSLQG